MRKAASWLNRGVDFAATLRTPTGVVAPCFGEKMDFLANVRNTYQLSGARAVMTHAYGRSGRRRSKAGCCVLACQYMERRSATTSGLINVVLAYITSSDSAVRRSLLLVFFFAATGRDKPVAELKMPAEQKALRCRLA